MQLMHAPIVSAQVAIHQRHNVDRYWFNLVVLYQGALGIGVDSDYWGENWIKHGDYEYYI